MGRNGPKWVETGRKGLTWSTSPVVHRDPSVWTLADHRAKGQGVDDATPCRRVTRRRDEARVLASLVDAGEAGGTVAVCEAFGGLAACGRLRRDAADLRVPGRAGGAEAGRGVIRDAALRFRRARVRVIARIHAFPIDAGLVDRTIPVGPAADDAAVAQGVSRRAGGTPTRRAMILRHALCRHRARVVQEARIHAVVLVTSLRLRAVLVPLAFDCNQRSIDFDSVVLNRKGLERTRAGEWERFSLTEGLSSYLNFFKRHFRKPRSRYTSFMFLIWNSFPPPLTYK